VSGDRGRCTYVCAVILCEKPGKQYLVVCEDDLVYRVRPADWTGESWRAIRGR